MIFAQDKNYLFAPEELKADIDYYYEMLYSKHPNPYYYYSLSEFEDVKNRVYAQLNKPLTKEQFSKVIVELNSCMDRHSQILAKFSYLDATDGDQAQKSKVFPLVKIREGKLFFVHDHTQDEIVEINEMAVSDLLADIQKGYNWRLPYACAVNFNQIRKHFTEEIYFTYKLKAPFRIKFANSNRIHIIEGFNQNEIRKQLNRNRQRCGMDDAYSYKIYQDNSIAIFYITNFYAQTKKQFEKINNEFIQAVNEQKIKYVFYDLSQNGGGMFHGMSAFDIVRHDAVYLRLSKICREGLTTVKKYKVNDMILPPNHDVNIPKDRKLFVLQGIATESCGDYFCRIVAENKLGVLVGQPTGEPTTGFTMNITYEMPHTKIPFKIATNLWDFSDYFNSETLNPDIYWDINHYREFTEKELMDIINHWKKIKN
jgi:hypothetical protein